MPLSVESTYFNTVTGAVYIGGTAVDQALEAGVHPADILPLKHVLLDSEVTLFPENYDRKKYHTDQEILELGSWISALVKSEDDKAWTSSTILDRSSSMALGPKSGTISNRFGGLWAFRDAIGEKGGWRKGAYDDWTTRDFIEYGKRLGGRREKKPTIAQIQRWFLQGKGPSTSFIRDRMGGIDNFQELLGFPNIHAWEESDYIEYGIRFKEANPDLIPTARRLDYLSQKDRGPSGKAVHTKFGSTRNFQTQIQEAYEKRREQEEAEAEIRLLEILQKIEAGELPRRLIDIEPATSKAILSAYAKYQVAKKLLGSNDDTAIQLSRLRRSGFTEGLVLRSEGRISRGTIETTAVVMDVFEDIWPFDDHINYLKIPK